MPFSTGMTSYEQGLIDILNEKKLATAHISEGGDNIKVTMGEVGTERLNSLLDTKIGRDFRFRDSYQTWKNVIIGMHFFETLNNLRTRGINIPGNGIYIHIHTGDASNQALASQNAIILKVQKPTPIEDTVPAKVRDTIGSVPTPGNPNFKEEIYREALIVHEIGHLMHAQTSPTLFSNFKSGDTIVNLSTEEKSSARTELGKYSTNNRLEFIAEAFTAMVYRRNLSNENIETYIKWGGCTEIIPDEKLLEWASKEVRSNDFQDIVGNEEERARIIRERINARIEH